MQFVNVPSAVRASVVFLPSDRGALSLTLPYWNSVDDLNYPLQHQSYMNLPIFLALGTTKLSPRIITGQEKGLSIKDVGIFFWIFKQPPHVDNCPSAILTLPPPLSQLPMSFMNDPKVKIQVNM